MNDFLNSNRLLSESICSDDIVGVRTALDRGAHLSGVVLLDDNMHTVECAVLNLPLNQAFNEKVSDEIITVKPRCMWPFGQDSKKWFNCCVKWEPIYFYPIKAGEHRLN